MNGIQKPHPYGPVIGIGVYALWLAHLLGCLFGLDFSTLGLPSALAHAAIQTFLFTGLFITAHDSIHGSLAPESRRLNRWIGVACTWSYALFSYEKLKTEHFRHHDFSGVSKHDPDFHDGVHTGFWLWYLHFIFRYVSWRQILGMALIAQIWIHGLHVPEPQVHAFWTAPALLSTLQLFYFGTYLPHREGNIPFTDRHRSRSSMLPPWLSFLTCYHFGYHWQHHQSPETPWWKLPSLRNDRT